jgi:hypothetical protein
VIAVAIGWHGEGERCIELCVIATATRCHEMSQIVMYTGTLTLALTMSFSIWSLIVFITPVKSWKSLGAGSL